MFMRKLFKFLVCAFTLSLYSVGANAQAACQTVCLDGSGTYTVNATEEPTKGSSYAWSILEGTPSDWTLTATTANQTTVEWKKRGTYTVQVIETSSTNCVGEPVQLAITVKPYPILSDKPFTVCSTSGTTGIGVQLPLQDEWTGDGGAVTITHYDISNNYATISGADFSGSAYATSGTPGSTPAADGMIADDYFKNTTGLPVDVVYTLKAYNDLCEKGTYDYTVTVNPQPKVNNIAAGTAICSSQNDDNPIGVNLATADNSATPLTIGKWRLNSVTKHNDVEANTANAAIHGATESTTSTAYIASDKYKNTTSATQSIVYNFTPYAATTDCEGDPFTITVDIKPQPVVENKGISACSDVAINYQLSNIVVTNGLAVDMWDISAPVISGGATLGTGSASYPATGIADVDYMLNDNFNNTTGANQTATYTITPYVDGCKGDDYTLVVTIQNAPGIPDPITNTICSGNVIEALPSADTNGTQIDGYYLTAINPHVDLAAVPGTPHVQPGTVPATPTLSESNYVAYDGAIATDAYRNTTDAAKTVVYSVTPYGGCLGTPFDYTVTVNPEPVVNGGATTACSDEPGNAFTTSPEVATTSVTPAKYVITGIAVDSHLDQTTTNVAVGAEYADITALEAAIQSDKFTNETPQGGDADYSVTYTVKPVSSNDCEGEEFTITTTVYKKVVTSAISCD
jgi:hypothetical protein